MKQMITSNNVMSVKSDNFMEILSGFFSLVLFLIGSAAASATPTDQPICDDFVYFLSNHPLGETTTDIYKVTLSGGNADLQLIITSDEEVHIAYNSNDNLIYAVGRNSHSYKTFDPNAADPEFSPSVDLGDSLSLITAAVFSPGGKLVFGSSASKRIYSVNVSTHLVSVYDAYAPVDGGDLTYASNGMLYLASRTGTGLYEVWPEGIMHDQLLPGSLPAYVTGMAITDIDQLLISSRGNTNLVLRNTDGSDAGSFAVMLDGNSFTLGSGDMTSGCNTPSINIEACDAFNLFYSNHINSSSSDLYKVSISGNDAVMTLLTTVDFEEHIAYNGDENKLLLVNANGSFVRVYDPVANTEIGDLPISGNMHHLYAAVYNSADGLLYVGDASQNKIYTINLTDGTSTFFANAPVDGGDLAIQNGVLYLATRQGDKLYKVVGGGSAVLVGSIPADVNGMAMANNTTTLLTSNSGASVFSEVSAANGSTVNAYNAILNGESFSMFNGDMASGCASDGGNTESGCNYKLYYVHSPSGNGNQPLLEVILNDDGTASYTSLIENIGGHIGLSPDGYTIYNVGGSILKVIDVATATVTSTVDIVTAGGEDLSGFPAAVVASDGTLYVANGSKNQVYNVNPLTGIAISYGPSRNVNGGDLIEVDGDIWLITRGDNTFTNVLTGASFTVPVNEIDGAAVLNNGNVLVADGDGGSLMKEIDLSTQEVVATYDIALPLHNGDLAGGCIGSNSVAEGCFGSEVLDFSQGLQTNGNAVAANRSDATQALGEPDRSNAPGGFVSLGVGGSITIGFAGVVNDTPGNDIKIWETSYKGNVCSGGSDEQADIELSADGVNFVAAGSICLDGEVDIASTGLPYISAIRITNSASTGSLDGYDVDGVEAINGCSNEPVVINGDCYATEVVQYIQGIKKNGGAMNPEQTNKDNATGMPERATSGYSYTTLGYGGSIILSFNGAVPNGDGDDIEVVETTYGNYPTCASYPEYAKVYVSVDGIAWFFAKTVCKYDGFVDISDAGAFEYINFVKIENDNELSTTPDAFDVDGVVALHNCDNSEPAPIALEAETQLTSSPNPTTGLSQVIFTPAKSGKTFVDVYDMNGRKIATIFDQVAQESHEYSIDFNALSLPNGFYVYVLTNNNETTIERFLIAK